MPKQKRELLLFSSHTPRRQKLQIDWNWFHTLTEAKVAVKLLLQERESCIIVFLLVNGTPIGALGLLAGAPALVVW
jgi:hypothetical protein